MSEREGRDAGARAKGLTGRMGNKVWKSQTFTCSMARHEARDRRTIEHINAQIYRKRKKAEREGKREREREKTTVICM